MEGVPNIIVDFSIGPQLPIHILDASREVNLSTHLAPGRRVTDGREVLVLKFDIIATMLKILCVYPECGDKPEGYEADEILHC